MQRVLYWHRRDLRLHDNLALLECSKNQVLVVYVLDPAAVNSDEEATFLLGCLEELQASYEDKGIDLQVIVGNPADVLSELCSDHTIDEIHAQHIPGDEEILDSLPTIPIRLYDTYTLFERTQIPADLPGSEQQFSTLMKDTWPPLAFAAPKELESFAGEKNFLPTPARIGRERVTVSQEPGEQEALSVLEELFSGDARYEDIERYLQYGCISPRKIFHEAKEAVYAHSSLSQELIDKLVKRDYLLFSRVS